MIEGVVLDAASRRALGKGDLYLQEGTLNVSAKRPLKVVNYT